MILLSKEAVVKKAELLARIYNHTEHKYQRGFSILTLGWTDGYSFVPVVFNMLSSANKSNRYQEMPDNIDRRTNGFKARRDSMLSKPEVAIILIKEALNADIIAECPYGYTVYNRTYDKIHR